MNSELNVGDLVKPVDPNHPLRSGCSAYESAVVIQVSPLVLVSLGADMRWESTIQNRKFTVIDTVDQEVLDGCMERPNG